MFESLRKSKRFITPEDIKKMWELAQDIVQLDNITNEWWFLTAEIVKLLNDGVKSISCLQPFACLPNHITENIWLKN
jgi:predicted nucleotide-binding protein (sugar kinase/HSP70/actin superfamily)